MEVWLLNNLSTFTLAMVVVGGIVVVAVLGSALTRRRYPQTASGDHNDMVGVVLSMFGAIYGVILAFVIVTLWTQLENAENVVAAEATAAAQIVRDAQAFPPAHRDAVDRAVDGYVHVVVEQQWPLMRDGQGDYNRTAAKLEEVYQSLQGYQPSSHSEQTFYDEAVDSLGDVAGQRRARITQSSQQLPVLLQVLVYGGAVVILPLTFLYGIRSRRIQLLFVGSVAALIGFSLLLVLVLDRPFAGELSVSPAPFKEGALAKFWTGPVVPDSGVADAPADR
ncbi:NADH-quinone oxidoreductase subunit J [Kitasatospora sp. KL5]|uniref:NADH-quinone oxidoreductase subunit J n=1 Tax=Kitasatospora sp. KL5 TaxID=3425125 RepID=UPI003D6E0E7B